MSRIEKVDSSRKSSFGFVTNGFIQAAPMDDLFHIDIGSLKCIGYKDKDLQPGSFITFDGVTLEIVAHVDNIFVACRAVDGTGVMDDVDYLKGDQS